MVLGDLENSLDSKQAFACLSPLDSLLQIRCQLSCHFLSETFSDPRAGSATPAGLPIQAMDCVVCPSCAPSWSGTSLSSKLSPPPHRLHAPAVPVGGDKANSEPKGLQRKRTVTDGAKEWVVPYAPCRGAMCCPHSAGCGNGVCPAGTVCCLSLRVVGAPASKPLRDRGNMSHLPGD
jgi:hypothetical protein